MSTTFSVEHIERLMNDAFVQSYQQIMAHVHPLKNVSLNGTLAAALSRVEVLTSLSIINNFIDFPSIMAFYTMHASIFPLVLLFPFHQMAQSHFKQILNSVSGVETNLVSRTQNHLESHQKSFFCSDQDKAVLPLL